MSGGHLPLFTWPATISAVQCRNWKPVDIDNLTRSACSRHAIVAVRCFKQYSQIDATEAKLMYVEFQRGSSKKLLQADSGHIRAHYVTQGSKLKYLESLELRRTSVNRFLCIKYLMVCCTRRKMCFSSKKSRMVILTSRIRSSILTQRDHLSLLVGLLKYDITYQLTGWIFNPCTFNNNQLSSTYFLNFCKVNFK